MGRENRANDHKNTPRDRLGVAQAPNMGKRGNEPAANIAPLPSFAHDGEGQNVQFRLISPAFPSYVPGRNAHF